MSFIPTEARTKVLGLERSFLYILKRYLYHIVATVLFFVLMLVSVLVESPASDLESILVSLFTAMTGGTPSWVVGFTGTPLTYIMVKLTPAFLAGVLITAATKFMRDLTGSEFELVRSSTLSKTQVEKVSNHVVVVGVGRVGLTIAQILFESGISVVGVDNDKNKLNLPLDYSDYGWVRVPKIGSTLNLVDRIPAIYSRGDSLYALEEANIKHASILCLMTGNFEENLFVLMSIKTLYPDLNVIARVSSKKEAEILSHLGVKQVIEPKSHGAEEIFHLLEASIANELKVGGVIKYSDVPLFLQELEDESFNVESFRRWQATSDYNYVQITVRRPASGLDQQAVKATFNSICEKYLHN